MIFQHSRFQVWGRQQHPYSHNPDEFYYGHTALPPGVNSMGATLDYILAVLYPKSQPAVADVASLPAAGNTINDMRVVNDDGDGKAASYRWEQREGDPAAKWYKIYDVDWGTDGILQAWEIKTQDIYITKGGYDDRDSAGVVIAGDLAGQTLYGGASAGSNLTLKANSGDGVGADTGFLQFADQVRPISDNTIDIGTTGRRLKKVWAYEYQAGTLVVSDGSITDSDGTIDFGSTILTSTGTITSGTLTLSGGSISDTTGAISFGDEDLTTTGDVNANRVVATAAASSLATGTTVGTLTLADASITDSSGAISFGDENLTTTGDITGDIITAASFKTTTLDITASTLTASGHLTLTAGAVNNIYAQRHLIGQTAYFNGSVQIDSAASLDIGNMQMDSSGIHMNAGADMEVGSSTGNIITRSIKPVAASTYDLGNATDLWSEIYFDGDLKNATQTISNATLFSFRDVNVAVAVGMAPFWDGSKWVPSIPDTEVTHGLLSGLTTGDAGHTQFALLAGRVGGQSIIGGTGASENITLQSTSNATRGYILLADDLHPLTDASYSGGWTGTDIGSPAKRIRHTYTVGEAFGLRLENLGANPGSSSQSVGRVIFNTADKNVYVDDGTAMVKVGDSIRYEEDLVWDGIVTSKNVTVTTFNMDARKAIWALMDNTNNYERVYGKITATGAAAVTVAVNTALPAGTYRIVGIQ